MRGVGHDTFGAPEQVLTTREVDKPSVGSGQLLVRMILSPIHNHDLVTVKGAYGVKPALPAVGGTEAVGVVEAVGEGLEGDLLGRRVVVAGSPGTWAEYFVAPAASVLDRKSTRLNSSHIEPSRMPSSA